MNWKDIYDSGPASQAIVLIELWTVYSVTIPRPELKYVYIGDFMSRGESFASDGENGQFLILRQLNEDEPHQIIIPWAVQQLEKD
ncbi:hypothetical protein MMC12_005215 [Toensbergia leucococca]|nr:hypothetical protein [Toensbergia leucococca]